MASAVSQAPPPRICNNHADLRVPSSRAHFRHPGGDEYREPDQYAVIERHLSLSQQRLSPEQLWLACPADYGKSFRIPRSIRGDVRSYEDSTAESMGRTSRT